MPVDFHKIILLCFQKHRAATDYSRYLVRLVELDMQIRQFTNNYVIHSYQRRSVKRLILNVSIYGNGRVK